MALSANVVFKRQHQPVEDNAKVVDGAVHIYEGALLEYELSNVGYVQPATADVDRPVQPEFAGIALEELNVAAADNAADGTKSVRILTRGCQEHVELTVKSTITIANIGDAVYMDGDDQVDLSSGVVNTTGGQVGVIRQFISSNKAMVQLT